MLKPDLERVRANVERATTEDLLDRATVEREGMEPEALELIEAELARRGVRHEEIRAHQERRGEVLTGAEGRPLRCRVCGRPATSEAWGWHRLWGVLPVFPRRFGYCQEHGPTANRAGSVSDD